MAYGNWLNIPRVEEVATSNKQDEVMMNFVPPCPGIVYTTEYKSQLKHARFRLDALCQDLRIGFKKQTEIASKVLEREVRTMMHMLGMTLAENEAVYHYIKNNYGRVSNVKKNHV